MQASKRNYPDWKAPSEDGQTLLWPDLREILNDTRANQELLSNAECLVQGVPLSEVRKRAREFIGHPHEQLLIATGHQAELSHTGVWAKNVLIDALAAKVDGQAFHVSVDSDAPKHLSVRWPGGEPLPITDDPKLTSAAWSGLLSAATPAHIEQIGKTLTAESSDWKFKPMLPQVLDSLRRSALDSPTLPPALVNAMHELDWSLGLKHHALLASPIWDSEPFLLFVYDLMARSDSVAAHYNGALQAYRQDNRIRTTMRPMPDLQTNPEALETPFWLDNLRTAQRYRPSVFRSDAGWILQEPDGDEFVFDPSIEGWEAAGKLRKWLTATQHRISPRALMLTMYLRLMLADQFIHGIGGARYDQVADEFIALHYNIQPPSFAVTTATLFFPDAVGQSRVCLPCVKQEGHRLKHNLLGSRKRELVAQIESFPRHSPKRTSTYFQMQRELANAIAGSDAMTRWQEHFQQSIQREKQEEVLFDRELFYAIQPRERLEELIEKYRAALP